jgi:glycerol-3-phosphate dehydrogenase (NAD(P)+)
MAALAATLAMLPPTGAAAVVLAKGLESTSGRLGHEVALAVRPGAPAVLLSGPSFAQEVAAGQPTALVAASPDVVAREAVAAALHGGALRVYTSADATGVAVGGAVKNVLAIATGLADGMGLGTNARAALVTRGLAEMARFGVALGAEPATFAGLSGLGDLVLTTTGELSRNRAVGIGLASGRSLADVLGALGHVAEGVASAPVVRRRAALLGVEMPIAAAVDDVLEGRSSPRHALAALLARAARSE